jgi:uncharacterized protein involved in propanediol utilization
MIKFGCTRCGWAGSISTHAGDTLGLLYARAAARHRREAPGCRKEAGP